MFLGLGINVPQPASTLMEPWNRLLKEEFPIQELLEQE